MSAGVWATGATGPAAQAALAAEHAAIWSYGLASAFLAGTVATAAVDAARVHRDRRDALEAALTGSGVAPAPAAVAYATPAPVTDAASAAGLLAVAEDDVAAAWRGLLERTDDAGVRAAAVDALTSAAVTGVRWRDLAGDRPPVDPFPGASRA